MTETPPTPEAPRRPLLSAAVTALLLAASALYSGYHLKIAWENEDTNHLETPLAMAVARQLEDGPATLYGPFSGTHSEVLIHAPLYYRLSGLLAWGVARFGVDPVTASLAAGRFVSVLGWLLTLGAVWVLGRSGGLEPVAGLWSALLVASSPMIGSLPETVRADMLAIGLQTWGFALIVQAEGLGASTRRLLVAFLAFGLAVCVKQHAVALLAVSSVWLLVKVARRQVGIGWAALAPALGS
ncbi:MAG TPA: DUF2142 domain-containing protein, partial [Isosphaeraceae bacterium]|nr:DUF2142 domain-containing protein [Isosphaeraceae bacterium]